MTRNSPLAVPKAVPMARWIERDEVQRLRDQGAQLVDVLDEEAYEKAHISGSINIPLKRIEDDAVVRLDGKRPIVLYCYDYL